MEEAMARLFIPGPTDVDPQVLAAQTTPMVGHRSQAFADLFAGIQPRIRQVFQTRHRVFITASSGTGLIEGALRNCVAKGVLVCACGAFAERWVDVAKLNGLPYGRVDAPWGQAVSADQVEGALRSGSYDTLAVVHNETSTGVENPVAEIAARARRLQPDIVILIDAVSSAGGVNLETDQWDLDVVLTSSQKCFALPPGLAFAAVSDRALERAKGVSNRGWYFDFLRLETYLERNTTPATPAVSLLYALDVQLDRMLEEGLQARFARHAEMAGQVRTWAEERFSLFAAEGYRSKSVTTVRNTLGVDVNELNAFLAREEMTIANGYGKLKGETFRIAHMGETQPEDISHLLGRIDIYVESHAQTRS